MESNHFSIAAVHNLRVVWEQSVTITYKYHFVGRGACAVKVHNWHPAMPLPGTQVNSWICCNKALQEVFTHLTSAALCSQWWQKVAPDSRASDCHSFHELCEVFRCFLWVFHLDSYSLSCEYPICDFTILDLCWLCYISYYLTNLGLQDGNYQAHLHFFQTFSSKMSFYSKGLGLISFEQICPSLLLYLCSPCFCCISQPIVIVFISTQSDVCSICIITSSFPTWSQQCYDLWDLRKVKKTNIP